ncbi:MAG: cell envelope integrity protein CreD [Balneolaceae bacterium]|nr:cell envelope integrity protein CreD [Balneolaceae bacterium]
MKKLKHSIGIRLSIVAFLTLIFLIPSVLIQELIREREHRRDSVADEISQKWGNEQAVIGPMISIPYRHYYNNDEKEGKVEHTIRYAHFLPDDLSIRSVIDPEVRYRGIYKAIVYNSALSISGSFPSIDLDGLSIPREDFLVEDAFVSVGISDMTGIKEVVAINWNGEEYAANPGIASNDAVASGISISPDIETGRAYSFDLELSLNGSSALRFSPVGKQTQVELSSGWPNPSFSGNFLPVDREVSPSGFNAEWKVLHLNRNFPQQWTGPNHEVSTTTFGVDLLLAVDAYQKTMRTAKYAIMFIALTFLTFFMIELLNRKVIHPIQYLLIGFALLIFYTLLLSLSEYIVFGLAYLIASAAIISLITIYSYSMLKDTAKTGMIAGVLIILYGYLYILLQLQDYALLLGSIGLFSVLALVMYLTRNINWFEVMSRNQNEENSNSGPKG